MEAGLLWCHTRGSLSSPSYLVRNPKLRRSSRKPRRRHHHREMRAIFNCMACRSSASLLSMIHRRLDSLEATKWAPRDTCHDLRGERSPLLPFETRPDSPGEYGMQPRDPCLPLRAISGPGHTPRCCLFCRAVTRAQPPAFPRNSNGRLGFLGPTQGEA